MTKSEWVGSLVRDIFEAGSVKEVTEAVEWQLEQWRKYGEE